MLPPTTLMLSTLVWCAPTSAERVNENPSPALRRDKLRVEGRVLSGFDSNVNQSSRRTPSSGVLQLAAGAEYTHRLPGNVVASGDLDLKADLWSADDADSRFRAGTSLELSAFVIGAGQIRGLGHSASLFPRLRLRLVLSYDFGFSLAQTFASSTSPADDVPPSGNDSLNDILDGPDLGESLSDDPDDPDDLTRSTLTLREPFHRASGKLQARFNPRKRTEVELTHRVTRALVIDADPEKAARHFTQFDVGLRLAQRLYHRVSAGVGYRIELRNHDHRTNDAGDPLHYRTHLTEGFIRYNPRPWSVRLRHRYRYRLVNEEGRDRFRHTLDLRGRWRFYGPITLVTEVAVSWEKRVGRSDRNWNRYQTVTGLQFRY